MCNLGAVFAEEVGAEFGGCAAGEWDRSAGGGVCLLY